MEQQNVVENLKEDLVQEATLKLVRYMFETMDCIAQDTLAEELADIVKLHAKIAVGGVVTGMFVPGLDLAIAIGNVWTMYARLNNMLGISFSKNLLKSIATGVVTNLGAFAGVNLIMGTVFKFFPGIGTAAAVVTLSITIYGITMASGVIYMNILSALSKNKNIKNISEEELKIATETFLQNKEATKTIFENAKSNYQEAKMRNDI